MVVEKYLCLFPIKKAIEHNKKIIMDSPMNLNPDILLEFKKVCSLLFFIFFFSRSILYDFIYYKLININTNIILCILFYMYFLG